MATLNIKPSRLKFIKALEDSIKRIELEDKEYEKALEAYNKALTSWKASADLSPSNVKSSCITLSYRDDEATDVRVTLKKYPANMPKKPVEPKFRNYRKTDAIEEIQGIIAMLKLTDEDVVNASVANKVAKYL